MFEIKFKTGNAAFCDPYTGEEDEVYEVNECRRILKKIIEKLDYGYREGSCIDINGNKVGEWRLK